MVELDPLDLGLSLGSTVRLGAWLERGSSCPGAGSTTNLPPPSATGRRRSSADMVTLAHDVEHELGPDVEVRLGDRPIGEYRGS